jgi:uncharacterized protein YdiU (UPF0061 family)
MIFHFDHSYSRKLPGDFFIPTQPGPVPNPSVVQFNESLAADLDMAHEHLGGPDKAAYFSGNKLIPQSYPIAQAYAGHQFGNFTMLGDGRALLLGEHLTKTGNRYDIQLKGSGQTAFSRGGDGRATLRSMLREYLISEAMAGLQIPTTRSLAVVATGAKVYREEVHDGGILTRIASSHIRVGTFEFANRFVPEALSVWMDYVIERHYPELNHSKTKARDLLEAVMLRQISLIVAWMRVGFIHGVMNTDNMSIAGETIDYGPCAFMNSYHRETVFSSIDTQGRYAFGNQPHIAHWNIACFAGSLLSLIHENRAVAMDIAKELLHLFPVLYEEKWQQMMFHKLGFTDKANREECKKSMEALLGWMTQNKADYTNTFLVLQGDLPLEGIYLKEDFQAWYRDWLGIEKGNEAARFKLMRQSNPFFIPRNYLVEEALDKACLGNDLHFFEKIKRVMAQPYRPHSEMESFFNIPEHADVGYKTYCGT